MTWRLLRFSCLASAAVVVIVLCAWAGYHVVVGADPLIVRLFGIRDDVELIRTAEMVEAFRIRGDMQRKPPPQGVRHIHGHTILAGPVVVDAETRRALAETLTSAWTYWWIGGKPCLPQPGLAFRFTKGNRVTEILICFECDELIVLSPEHGERYEDFDYGRDELVRIAKRLFPADDIIQSLD